MTASQKRNRIRRAIHEINGRKAHSEWQFKSYRLHIAEISLTDCDQEHLSAIERERCRRVCRVMRMLLHRKKGPYVPRFL